MIPAHTLYGDYPEKIPEDEIKPIRDTGEIVLSRVVVPEFVWYMTGHPRIPPRRIIMSATGIYVKNVASSEIYATWPRESIKANVLAIMSFTLNRVYTEWYRNKGYDFTITLPQPMIISGYTDGIFSTASRMWWMSCLTLICPDPNVKQPILTQYCDGRRVSCPDWMSQWGCKSLGDQGYQAIDILRYYYGDNMYINSAEEISGIPASWPGENLILVPEERKCCRCRNSLTPSVRYTVPFHKSPRTEFSGNDERGCEGIQRVFGLPATGVVDYKTWYKIQEIYVAVTRIAELV